MATIFDGTFCAYGKRATPKFNLLREVSEFSSEFVGTLMFAYFGSMASDPPLGNGMALAVMVYCTAAVSGGKLNPVVSAAVAIIDPNPALMSIVKVLFEWVAQIGGAMLGVYAARKMAYNTDQLGCFAPSPNYVDTPKWAVMGNEAFATCLLVLTVLSTAVEEAGNSRFAMIAPLVIGLSLYVAANAVGAWTGGSLNPARFLGSALVPGCDEPMKYATSYLVGETLGGVVAVLIHMLRDLVRRRIACSKPPPKPAAQPVTKAPIMRSSEFYPSSKVNV